MPDVVNIGTNPNDGTGDAVRTAFAKLNAFLAALDVQVAEIEGAQESGMLGFATLAALNADLAHGNGTVALVTNDPTPANNIVYRKSGASGSGFWVAQAAGIYATTGEMDAVQAAMDVLQGYFSEIASEEPALALTDSKGRSALEVDQTGLVRIANLRADAQRILHTFFSAAGVVDASLALIDPVSDFVYAITDENGRVALGVRTDGEVVCGLLSAKEVQSDAAPPLSEAVINGNFSAEVNHFPCYGQSWSTGTGTNEVWSTSQRFDNLMLSGGVRTQSVSEDPAVYATSLMPLVERLDAGTLEFPTSVSGETPVAGQTDAIKELILAENHIAYAQQVYQLLGSAPGEGGKSLDELSKPSTYYTRLMNQIQYGFNLAQAAGKSFAVQAVSWVQGGGAIDDNADYAADLEALRVNIDTDAKAITGQANAVKLIAWQPFPGISEVATIAGLYDKYVGASERFANIICAGATYHLDQRGPANLHLTAVSNKWLGAYLGLAYKRVIIDGEAWLPLKPIAFVRQGKVLRVKFHVPQPPLAWDIERVAENTHYGFELLQADGTPKTVESVSLIGPDTVKVVAAAAIGATDRLVYGNIGTEFGRLTGKRGNLRDSQGDFIVFNGGALDLQMHNWCVVFDKTIG